MPSKLTWFREHKSQTLVLLAIGLVVILLVCWRIIPTGDVLYVARSTINTRMSFFF